MQRLYSAACPGFPRPVGPRAAFADLRAFMRQRSREQVIGAALAVLVTTIIVIEFLVNSKINTAPPPHGRLCRQLERQPHRRGDRRPAEDRPGQARRGRQREAAAIPEAGKAARNVSADARFMAEAVRLGEAARGRSAPNPNVGCVIVSPKGEIVGRGATAAGGRPHAEAVALEQAGDRAKGATVYVTLEPCAHVSERGPACADLLVAAGPARVVIALKDPDPRTAGKGIARLRDAGIEVKLGVGRKAAARIARRLADPAGARPPADHAQAGACRSTARSRLPSGESKWITGEDARRHVHLERAQSDMILVGRGTYLADAPRLDVRLPGLEDWSPRRALLTRGEAVDGWEILAISAGCVPAS